MVKGMKARNDTRMANAISDLDIPLETAPAVRRSAGRLIGVCVVEDDSGLRRNLSRIINQATGMRCLGSWPEGTPALQEIPALQPDVVLMDINMAGMSGIECTARLKQICPKTQVIMVTVYNDSENIFRALQAGACGYLLKRTSATGIIEAINEVSNGGAPMTSEIARKLVHAFQSPAATSGSDVELTQREREILKLMSLGSTDKKIAADLNLSFHTVKVHARNIYEKLHIHSRAEAVMRYAADKSLAAGSPAPRPSQL
jgi:DNA-binding NarL/FixJ family response regulator